MVLNCRHLQTTKDRRRRAVVRKASLATAMLAILFAAPVHAEDAAAGAVSQKEVQAKLAYCEVCHGVAAQGFNGYYPIPRLAGQQIAYIENELQGFVEHKRTNNIMFNVGHVLSPAMIKALATDFHDLNPKAARRRAEGHGVGGRENLSTGITRRRRSAMRLMSRPGGQGQRPVSSAGGPALSVSRGPIDQLG